uniref:Ubiquitin-like domain-containing protein n=1 Tax=Chloropicon primus TaxID=1764295 RepID=A0A7S2T3B7_9CHLO|mmetsp:Transcript_4262/g.12493  ORF Transcript_4262/g.12493 Transcript_4262/m.12493 type:complete len:305 (+) Transcript_4262:132-1046(+)
MAERLVFVTIKGGPTLPSGRPLRRAVVPVDASTTFEAFQNVVKKKLRVQQVGSFYSKTGNAVSTMNEVMMVDDLEVEEIKVSLLCFLRVTFPFAAPFCGFFLCPELETLTDSSLVLALASLLPSPVPGLCLSTTQAEPTAPMTPVRRIGLDRPLSSPAGGSGRRLNSHNRRPHETNGMMSAMHGNGVSGDHDEEDENGKHKSTSRMGTQINVMLQKVGLKPSPGLPVTNDGRDSSSIRRGNSALRKTRKGAGGAARKAKGRSNMSLVVSISMVVCFFTMIALYYSLTGAQSEAVGAAARPPPMG